MNIFITILYLFIEYGKIIMLKINRKFWRGAGSIKRVNDVLIILALSIFALGAFFEFISCIVSVTLMVCLYINFIKDKAEFKISKSLIFMGLIFLGYLISIFVSIDKGISVIGVIKFLPVPLFALYVSQIDIEQRKNLINTLPIISSALVVISVILNQIDNIANFLNVDGKIAGFFQYPNTFAMLLVISVLILLRNRKSYNLVMFGVMLALLTLGVVLSGSRTGLIMLFLTVVYYILSCIKSRKATIIVTSFIVITGIVGLSLILSGVVENIIGYSVNLSTYIGRIIYTLDAIPQILLNPLGLGYYGYFHAQGEFKTAVYTITYAHNDFVQVFLDGGWIAGVALISAIVLSIKSKTQPKLFKELLVLLSIFILLDFHLQYISIFLILILLLDFDTKLKKIKELKYKKAFLPIASIIIFINIYFGVTLSAEYFGYNDTSIKLYPYNTRILVSQMVNSETTEDMNQKADEILKINDSVAIAYEVKANYAFSLGDFEKVIEYKEKDIALSRYNPEKYEAYIDMLMIGIDLANEAGYTDYVQYFAEIITDIPNRMETERNELSFLAYYIDDKPEHYLSDTYEGYVRDVELKLK